jgi:hypothetical protein
MSIILRTYQSHHFISINQIGFSKNPFITVWRLRFATKHQVLKHSTKGRNRPTYKQEETLPGGDRASTVVRTEYDNKDDLGNHASVPEN